MWMIIGALLAVWVLWDLYAGYTMLWGVIYRAENPGQYWLVLLFWASIAVSCFFA